LLLKIDEKSAQMAPINIESGAFIKMIFFASMGIAVGGLWGCFASFARKTPPQLSAVTVTPLEPLL